MGCGYQGYNGRITVMDLLQLLTSVTGWGSLKINWPDPTLDLNLKNVLGDYTSHP